MSDAEPKRDLAYGGEAYKSIVKKSSGLLYTAYINRNLAWFFSRNLLAFTPNQVSIGAFCLLFIALPIALSSSSIFTSAIAYLILVLNYVLDSSDGQVSRLRKMGSPLGEWVDHSLDGVRIILVHATLLYIVQTNVSDPLLILLCYANVVFAAGLFFATELAGKILPKREQLNREGGWTIGRAVRECVFLPADHGIFILLFLFVHKPVLLAKAYALYGIFWALMFLGFFVKTFRANSRPA